MNGISSSAEQKGRIFRTIPVSLALVYGIMGTSPVYLMSLILTESGGNINDQLVYGVISAVSWILIGLVLIKQLVLVLETDNRGEGGIFALYALFRKKTSRAVIFVIIGGSAILSGAIIAPALTLTASVEGAQAINPEFPVVPVVAGLFALLFFIQRFKPGFVADYTSPLMTFWFLMLLVTGLIRIAGGPGILASLNPVYALKFIAGHPGGFIMAGSSFLCIAGIESVYQELGTYGKSNLRISGLVVVIIILVSFMGQGAWILENKQTAAGTNPFFAIIPHRFLVPGIIVSVIASLIASQSVIDRTFTLLSEAVSLNFFPNIRILHPTQIKGQVYMPLINWMFWAASTAFVIIFRNSAEMAAGYGMMLAVNMITTSILMVFFYQSHEKIFGKWWMSLPLLIAVEMFFLVSVLSGFKNSELYSLAMLLFFFLVMLGWYFGRKIKNRYITFANISDYTSLLTDLHNDKSVPITATNLVYIIKANSTEQVESKVIYSILRRQPKRAETYWFLHIDRVDEPDRFDYEFLPIIPGVLHRVDFHLGFKVEPRINLYFREVLEDLVASGEISLSSSFNSLKKFNFTGDFKYILIDRVMLRDNKLSAIENFLLVLHNLTRLLDITDERALHLDLTNTIVEKIPVTLEQPAGRRITRIEEKSR